MTKSEKFEFLGADETLLAGRIEHADQPICYAIFAHCFTCSKNAKAASRISRGLAEAGISTLRFDFTGLGNSEGDFSNTNFSSNVQDLVAAADALKAKYQSPKLIVGHSLGGTAALFAAKQISSVKAASSIGSPFDPAHVTHLFSLRSNGSSAEDSTEVQLGGRSFRIKRQFIDDVQQADQKGVLRSLGKPVAIFHSPVDSIVEIQQASKIYQTLQHPKSFISVDGADHMLTDQDDASFVAAILANWSKRYVSK